MQISKRWLSDYINLGQLTAEEIAKALTDLGLEVESIEETSPFQGEVVVGRILEAKAHPNAESLRCCLVEVGGGEPPLEIVCGAPNARKGLVTAVAKVGSTLPGDFKIKKSKIRGEVSCGMMCAEDELGLSANHDCIVELSESAPIGVSIADHLNLNETVFTLSVTPNRSDALSYLGIARELSAKFNLGLTHPELTYKGDPSLNSLSEIKIGVESKESCTRFCALIIKGVDGKMESPAWLKQRLESSGVRAINLIVDITNYVMLECGQPVHAYDLAKISGSTLIVKNPHDKDKFLALDGKEYVLSSEDLVVADAKGALGLAGVMGGSASEVGATTEAIVVEAAHFHASLVRKTSKRLGIHTEASHRFERGVDLDQIRNVTLRVAHLIQKLMGPTVPTLKISSTVAEYFPEPRLPAMIALRLSRVQQLLGMRLVLLKDVSDCLGRLGIMMMDQTHDGERGVFLVPSWRHDIVREVDLIEEFARLNGYEKIPFSLPMVECHASPEHPFIQFLDETKILFSSLGFLETISFPFMSDNDMRHFKMADTHFADTVEIKNPLSQDEKYLHTSLAPTLTKALARNRTKNVKGVRLFETARGYFSSSVFAEIPQGLDTYRTPLNFLAKRSLADPHRVHEVSLLGFTMDTPSAEKTWSGPEVSLSLFEAKALISQWLSQCGLKNFSIVPLETLDVASTFAFLHPLQSLAVMHKTQGFIGYFGFLNPTTAAAYDFKHSPIFGEVLMDALYLALQAEQSLSRSGAGVQSPFPDLSLDLSLVAPEHLTYATVEKRLKDFPKKKYLLDVKLFDLFRGPALGENKKCFTFHLVFRSPKKTLSDKDIEFEMKSLLEWLTGPDQQLSLR